MSRCTRGIIIVVPLIVLALVAVQFFQLSDTISEASAQAWRSTRSHSTQVLGSGLTHLGIARHPQIGKCTVMHGKHNDGYKQALETHYNHAKYHGYPTYVLDRVILKGLWTKEAALLEMMLEALSKPKGERLKWIFWFDADTVIMNKLVPLEVFLPPDDRNDVHLLYTKDWNGLNNGVFFLRVSEWSVEMLSAVVAYRTFKPKEDLPFTEQTAMEKVLEMEQYSAGAVSCPPQWFNAYPSDGGDPVVHFDHKPGQLLVHFAGIADKSKAIGEWATKLKKDPMKWEMPLSRTNYEQQIAEFWDGLAEKRKKEQESIAHRKEVQSGNETDRRA